MAGVDLRPPLLGAFPGAGDPVDDLSGAGGVAGLDGEDYRATAPPKVWPVSVALRARPPKLERLPP